MAVLTPADYRDMRDSSYRKGSCKEELAIACATMPNETKMMQVFQAAEDRTVAAFTLFRADMESIFGIPANANSLALAIKLYAVYCSWKSTHV